MPKAVDTLKTKRVLKHDGVLYAYFSLPEAARHIGDIARLPFSLKVNLEHLAQVVIRRPAADAPDLLYPDTCVGTDSHTTMVNGLGVLGWGVGGIEAEAVMLGQPVSLQIPDVVGYRLSGRLREGASATDLVLTITENLRRLGVVGKFVEFHGPGVSQLALPDRATIANMAPEYGATCGIFPIDAETVRYLNFTNRNGALVEKYARANRLWHDDDTPAPVFSSEIELDLFSFERIHRTNLVCMGVLPLQFEDGFSARALQLTGAETFTITGVASLDEPGQRCGLEILRPDGSTQVLRAMSRIDTKNELAYFKHGGILNFVLRGLLA